MYTSLSFSVFETINGVESFFGRYTKRDAEAVLRIFAGRGRIGRMELTGTVM